MKVLLLNACARKDSRTLELTKYFLEEYGKVQKELEVEEVELCKAEDLLPLNEERLELRNQLIAKKDWSHPMMGYAKQWKEAEYIVIAAPYWDWSFPSILKVYIESIFVSDLTFMYQETRSVGLCKGKKILYLTTAGGDATQNMGFDYIKEVVKELGEYTCDYICANGLDVLGADVSQILEETKQKISTFAKTW